MDMESVVRLLFDVVKVLIWPVLITILLIKYARRIDEILRQALKARRAKIAAGPTGISVEWDLIEEPEATVTIEPANTIHRTTSTQPTTVTEQTKRLIEAVRLGPNRGTGEKSEKVNLEYLSLAALKVLSTLWKHQQQYHPKRWSFAIGPLNLNYSEYALGVGQTILLNLAAIAATNGQIFLTDTGIEYCKAHQDEFFPDWNYDRWKEPASLIWTSLNYIGIHGTQKGIYRLHYDKGSRNAYAIGPLVKGKLFIHPEEASITISGVLSEAEAERKLKEKLEENDRHLG